MNILVVTQYFWPENLKINDVAKGLLDKGHNVSVLTECIIQITINSKLAPDCSQFILIQ